MVSLLATPVQEHVIRRQESVLIVLNLAVLAAIAFFHVVFGATVGTPQRLFFVVLMGRFLMQASELSCLQAGLPRSPRLVAAYANASIWINVGFAFGLAILGGMEDTHYIALMVVPVIAAAFRYTPFGIAVVVSASTVLTFLELWLYYRHHVPVSGTEYFEATNVVLIYVVVAAVVALLAAQLRRDRAQLERSLEELGRTRDRLVTEEKLAAVGRLASSIAHEIRNPVAMIVSALAVVNDETADPAQRRELCGIAGEEAKRLESLTTDFLAYALQRAPERRLTSAATTIGYVADLARARAAQNGVVIEARCPAELDGSFDPFQVHQALLNLVINAIDATPEGRRITLGAGRDGDGIEFWVENEGDAVPPGNVPRLFEPFFSSKPRGTGLGLAIARAVAHRHGGDAELEANEPGRVRFTLRLGA